MLTPKPTTRVQSDAGPMFPPLERETRPAIPTAPAAYYLSRQQQTLRLWAMRENGPIRPLRVHGRLLWPTAELRRLLGVPQ
jgi:hypothetical protein